MTEQKVQHYVPELQKLYISFMLSDAELFSKALPIIKPEYWEARYKKVVKYILEFYEEYKQLPNLDQVFASTQVQFELIGDVKHHHKWFLDEIESFCRHKAMEHLIYEGPNLVEEGNYAEIETRVKENMLISINTDIGLNYFDNPYNRLQEMVNRSDMTPTGWSSIDKKLYGGMNRGELTIFAGGPGSGKSLFLQNIALNWVQMGLDVVYITLELSEHLISLRFDAMITEQSTKDIFKDLEHAALKVSMTKKTSKWGNLAIKKFPQGGTRCIDLRAFLREYEIQNGKKPDALCVDYMDLLHPNNSRVNPSDLFVKDKYVSEELRALAEEFGVLMASASQLGRGSVGEQSLDISHIAGGISKVNTADNVLAIYVTPQMKENGQYQIQFIKTRSSSGVGSHVWLKFYPEFLRIVDADTNNETEELNLSKNELLKSKLNRVSSQLTSTPSSSPDPEVIKTNEQISGVKKGLSELASLSRNSLKKMND